MATRKFHFVFFMVICVLLITPMAVQASEEIPESPTGWDPIILREGGYLYYDSTYPFTTHWRASVSEVIPFYRARVLFEGKNIFGDWNPEYTVDAVRNPPCMDEFDNRIPKICWDSSTSAELSSTDPGKVFIKIEYLVYMPLIMP